jgi:trimeric autotransporter adhesin
MSKLIGTNPNQVPSNADLGTAAFMDKKEFLLSKGSSLSAINAVIPKTAVDVFIYDTTKDSDGGAWRKRVQHTSWYNERLSTTTRGSRKEFPVVAVIVAETAKVTIYDADDINMPMWMVFEINNNYWLKHTSSTSIAVSMMNATLVTGGNGVTGRVSVVEFIADRGHVSEPGYNYKHNNISRRNIDPVGSATGSIFIINISVNDVAMTVLPNAPIDPTTGLPVPTIAVATQGGVSVIKDDGSVVDITVNNASYTFARRVNFLSDNSLGMGIGVENGVAQESYYIFNNIPTSDNVITVDNIAGTTQNVDEFYAIQTPNALVDLQLLGLDSNRALRSSTGNSFASDEGLSVISRNVGAPDKGLISYIASDYNTGWMHGDIKLATLSDTDTTNVTGSELVTNGDFSNGTTGWTDYTGGTNFSVVNGQFVAVDDADQAITVVAGNTYVVNCDVITGLGINIYGNGQSTGNAIAYVRSATNKVTTFVAPTNEISVYIYAGATVDNISVRLAEEDRSVNNNGLQVFGTITKTPVATGADLVAYSGFSTSNYLQQPYNSSLGLSSTDYLTIMCWVKQASHNGTIQIIFASGVMSGGQGRYLYTNSGIPRLDTYGGATNNSTRDITDNTWHHLTAIYTPNGIGYMYIDGILDATPSLTAGYINQTGGADVRIGLERNNTLPTNASISLLRVSNSVPTPEQIAKIYNDEKHLFQENAKATLYGSSDAVTALAYDDDTELLHVGTSAGRSVFQGLRRVDNTTDAVGTAISASNGFIVED